MSIFKIISINTRLVDGKNVVTKIHRTYVDDILTEERYFNNKNELHRDANSSEGSGPALILYKNNTKIEYWYQNGKLYRDEKDKFSIVYYKNNIIISEMSCYIRESLKRKIASKYVQCSNNFGVFFVNTFDSLLPCYITCIENELPRYVGLLIGVEYNKKYFDFANQFLPITTKNN